MFHAILTESHTSISKYCMEQIVSVPGEIIT
jgi:hypothetical protein